MSFRILMCKSNKWNGFSHLNSENPNDWERILYKVLTVQDKSIDKYANVVNFIILSQNWNKTISQMLGELKNKNINIDIDKFFSFEREASFNLAGILSDINILYAVCRNDKNADVSPFIAKLSNAFLPKVVYELEEYGLPRMISKKINDSKIILLDYNVNNKEISEIIAEFKSIGCEKLISKLNLSEIEKYIVKYFYDGISLNKEFEGHKIYFYTRF